MASETKWEIGYDQVWYGGMTLAVIIAVSTVLIFLFLPWSSHSSSGLSHSEMKQIIAEVIAADRAHLDTAMKNIMEVAVKRGHAIYLDSGGTRYFQWLPPCNPSKNFKLLPEDCAVPLAEIYGPASSGGNP